MGDRLVVGCSTDEFNTIKGKQAIFTYADRKEILQSCKYVDLVIPEESWDQKPRDIVEYNVDCFAIGDDWAGKFDFLEEYSQVVYLPRTHSVSTTDIKQVVAAFRHDHVNELRNILDHMSTVLGNLEVGGRSDDETR